MLIYKNTFDNIRTINTNYPVEDQFYASIDEAIVADKITRDPIGISDLSTCSPKMFLEKYPRPSGGELAAKAICDTFSKTDGSLINRLIKCNESVKDLNDKYIKKCDYLENDFYGAVCSCACIKNNVLNYAYICDCGIIVYDKYGNVRFQTEDDKELYSDPYIIKLVKIPWHLPESRVIIRRDFRNNLNNIQDGKCVSYGAFTGEESALKFIKIGQLELNKGDIVAVYTDGIKNFLHDESFISLLLNFETTKFEQYIKSKSQVDYEKYGKEKTIVLFKN